MKRFWRHATVRPGEGGDEVLLDERPVKTPARRPLALPTARLAQAIADEWNAQSGEVRPHTMPLTGLANAAIDRVAPDKDGFAAGLALYGETDLLCYRADGPPALVARQAALWNPILAWARRRYDVEFELVTGIVHRPQPPATVARLAHAVCVRDAFELAAFAPLVTIPGSLLIALSLAEEAIDLDAAWSAGVLDEAWQAERWGADAEAAARLDARRAEFEAAERFLRLLG